MTKLTAIVKTPEEILGPGARGVVGFLIEGIDFTETMYELAGTRISLTPTDNRRGDYWGGDYLWKKEWLRDFEEEVDWSKVPVDTKIEVRHDGLRLWYRRHFAVYENGKVYAWDDGRTSFSANSGFSPWPEARLYREDNQ